MDVDVLELDVLALDGKDRPVGDLAKDDFEVRIAGKPQPLEFFDPPSPRLPAAPEAPAAPAVVAGTTALAQPDLRSPLHLLFFVDLEDLPLLALRESVPAVEAAVSRVPPPVRLSVASHFGRSSPLVWEEEALDRVSAALDTMAVTAEEEARDQAMVSDGSARGGAPGGENPRSYEARQRLERQLLDNLVAALDEYQATAGRDARQMADAWRQIGQYVQGERVRVRDLLDGLRKICEDFASLEGRKVLVFVSRGFERSPGFNLLQAAQIAAQSFARGGGPPDLRTSAALPGMPGSGVGGLAATPLPEYDDFAKWLAASGITLHFLDPSRATDLPTAEQGRGERYRPLGSERMNLQESGTNLASATGGLARLQPGDLAASLVTFLDASAGAYRLGVRMTDVDPRRSYKVDVRVRRSGVRALARSAYRPKVPGMSATAAVAAADLQRLRSGVDERLPGAVRRAAAPIRVTLAWKGKSPAPAIDGKNLYKLDVLIPYDDLKFLPEEDALVSSTRISVVADSAEGKGRESFSEDLFLSMTGKEFSAAVGTQAEKTLTLTLAPGRWSLSISVTDLLETRTGIARTTVAAEP